MKRSLSIAVAILINLTLVCAGCTPENREEPSAKPDDTSSGYDIMKLSEIPLGLWVTPAPGFLNNEEYARIRASGLNFVNGFPFHERSNGEIKQALEYCENNDLKFLVCRGLSSEYIKTYSKTKDAGLVQKFTDGIKSYASYSAYAGELIMDEPGQPLFPAISVFTKAFKEAYPEKVWNVNLFPTYATGGIQSANYETYLSGWIMGNTPELVSFDHYPLLENNDITEDYYYNLDLVRAKTRFKKLPFWTFIQTLSIAGTSGVANKRDPSETDIRWQVWSNLAMGAKGLQYFCYWTPGSAAETFGDAMIDSNGKPTPKYGYVKALNGDIKHIGKILLQSHPEGCIFTPDIDYRLFMPLHSFGPLLMVSGTGGLTGCFSTPEGERILLITTARPTAPASVTLQFDETVTSLKVVDRNVEEQRPVTGNSLRLNVSAGSAILIKL